MLQCSLLWAAWPWFPAHAADLDILHGGVLLLGLALGFGLTWWFLRPSAVSEFPHASADNALPVILDTADGGFYYQNLQSGREEISHRLVQMLGLSQNAGGFNVFASLLDENSHVILRNAIMDLKKDKKDLYFHVLTKEGKKHLECCASSLPGMMGDVREIIVWFRDVTVQQKQITRIGRENEKLKLELKLFSSILNALPLPVWQRAEDLSIRYCNLAFSEAAEETPERVVEAEDLELHSYAKQLARIAKNAGELKSERRHMVVGGHRKLYQFTEIPMLPDPYLVGVAQDVTELELVQEELERHISAQKDFLESSASAMAVFGSDTRLRFFNFAFVRLWGLDEAWLGNQPTYSEVLEFLREKRRLPEQANFPVFKQQQLRLFTDLIEPREEFLYLPDGKTLRVLAIPHALGGVLFAYEDVTDRLALERSYNTLIAVQKATLDNLHEGVAVFGEDGRMRLCNPVYLKLWKLEDKTLPNGIHISEVLELTKPLYDFKQWDSYKQEMTNLLHQRKVTRQRLERTDGTVLDCIFVPLPDGATIITYFDVTDSTLVERSLREKNEALQDADRLKTEFLANVSYELRSPLTSISGFSEMLRQDYFGELSDKQREYVAGIHQSSQHLMQLINDILDIASIEAGYMHLDVKEFDIYAALCSIRSLISERVKENHITLTVECPKTIGAILGDETRIKQILFNLLSNAIKFTEKNGKISIGAAPEINPDTQQEEIMLWVEDNGVGIAPEEQEAVFNKFHRGAVHKSGAGLGLAMVKSFVELHGGRVRLISGENAGTKIVCCIPRNNPDLLDKANKAA